MRDELIEEAVEQFHTPMYLYQYDQMVENHKKLRSCLPEQSSLFYSMKANPLLGICQIMNKLCDGIEVASAGELYMAMKAGIQPENIIFSSPGKTEEELDYAVRSGIHMINIESIKEAELLQKICTRLQCQIRVSIRINPKASVSNAKIKMSGVSSQFGIEEDIAGESIRQIRTMERLNLAGIQVYMGTQNLNVQDIRNNTEYILEMVDELSEEEAIDFSYVNVGGGFGVPYFKNETELNLEELKLALKEAVHSFCIKHPRTKIIFESGRFLMADAGVYVTKILYKKESKGTCYLVCDGGSNFHSASAFLGRFVRNNYPMHILNQPLQETLYTVTGPLCTPTDLIGQKVLLSEQAKPGDYVVIEKSGAYGLTFSPSDFLGHEKPIELLLKDGTYTVLRERGNKEAILSGQIAFVQQE